MSDYASSPSRPATPVPALPEIPQVARPFRLNWDTSSRVRGSGSVSETTEGRGGDYFATPFRLELPNLSTTNIALGALPQEWSSSTQGFNGRIRCHYAMLDAHYFQQFQRFSITLIDDRHLQKLTPPSQLCPQLIYRA
jgi:hypothetical protein